MSFFTELKRRNVYRVGAAYLIAAWFLLQVTSTFAQILGLPSWTLRFVFLLLVIGLVPTLFAAWALEMTPEGVKFEKDVDRSKTETGRTGRRLNVFIIGTLALIIAFLVIERVFFAGDEGAPAVTDIAAEPDKSVAVLPFADFSENQDQDWFADGLADEILNALARTPDLMVSSRTSTFNYKGTDKDISTIARELGVAHVLEGSIRGTDDRVRVTAQLIRAADDFHVWSQTYDRDMVDVIGIQEDIAVRIATALETTMDPEALEGMMRVDTRSVSAYQAYIRGLGLRARALRTADQSSYLESYEQIEEARRIDPKFAVAHRMAADFWKVQLDPTRRPAGLTDLTPPEILEKFLERVDLAIDTATDSIDQSGSRAQKAAVQLRLRTAIRHFRVYLEARPNDYRTWYELLIVAQLAADRESASEALAALKSGGERDRFAATTYVSAAYRFGEASAAADYGLNALDRWPNDSGLPYQTHRSLLWAMRIGDATNLVAQMNAANSGNRLIRARQACAEGRREDVQQILEQLRADDGKSIASEWMILMLLGENQEATELLRVYESGEVPYQLASWLIFHKFDPTPFLSLARMLEREDVQRPPAVEIPFACPQIQERP